MTFSSTQPTLEFGAVLIGFDVEGFSRTVDKAALRHGRRAGELAAQRILAGENVVTALAHRAGFRFADALGDGAVYLRAQDAPTGKDVRGLQRLREELEYAHFRQTGLSVRTAWVHGPTRLIRPTAPMLEHNEVLWGPTVARLHAGLSARDRRRRPAPDHDEPRPDLANRDGEIAEMTFVFLRLCRSEAWASLDEPTLNAALGLIGRWAERLGGRLERVTQDEKGAHVRVGLPGVNTSARDWPDIMLEAQNALRGLGLDGAVAAAGGPVYRGPSEHGSTIVHGGAVNRAAKLCARQPPGGLAIDPSLAEPRRRTAPVADILIGRESEGHAAASWLAGDGPRMVILSGEPGIGKSHLLREVLARGETPAAAVVAGAPARMLDPMGVWFEVLSQAIASHWPDRDDQAWAEAAFDEAGVDRIALGLCARALRGAASVNPRLASLTGGERARRTQNGMEALIRALTKDGPLVVAIDDLHELDEASLEFTARILDTGAHVRIIAGMRPSTDDGLLAGVLRHLSSLEIPLLALTGPEVGAVVGMLGARGVDLSEVMAISAGNPFQAIQAALALIDGGGDDGDRTLSALLDRRLDRLDADERQVLRALAIADRSWRPEDLDAIAPPNGASPATRDTLARLAQARLIAPTAGDPDVFQTAHRLLAELVRRRMPAGVARGLAMGAARHLSTNRADEAAAPTAEIARLWEAAGSRGRAAILYERAARSAAIEGADGTCAQLLSLALRLFEAEAGKTLPRRSIRWLAELSRARWSLGLVDTANAAARQAVFRARRAPLPRRLRESALAASAMRAETGQFMGEVREILSGALESRRFGADSRERVIAEGRGLSVLGYLLGLVRLDGPADRVLSQGERLAAGSDPRPAAFALTARTILHFMHGRWSEGEAALAQAREICLAWPQHQLMEVIETTCGIGAHLRGDGDRALGHFEALAGRAAARGSSLHLAWADYATAQTLLALDRPHEAWTRLGAADDRLRGLGDRQSRHICLGLRARLAWRLGEVDEALAVAARCGAMSRTLPPTNYSSTEAYSAPALVGALALANPRAAPRTRAARLLARRHLTDLARYAWVFPIARPRLAMVKAVIAGARRPDVARTRLELVARSAERLGLGFEASLARQIAMDIATAT
jgi:hypothetical protein